MQYSIGGMRTLATMASLAPPDDASHPALEELV